MGRRNKFRVNSGSRGEALVGMLARESGERKGKLHAKLERRRLQRAIDRELADLVDWRPPAAAPPPKKKGRKGAETWQLRGAARPADRDRSLEDVNGRALAPPQADGEDLLTPNAGRLGAVPQARGYLDAILEMARFCAAMGFARDAKKYLRQLLELDGADVVCARHCLVSVFLEEGDGGEARALMDSFPEDDCVLFAYSRALLEFVSWRLLEEEGSSEEAAAAALQTAIQANPFVAVCLAYLDPFMDAVGGLADIGKPQAQTVEEAFVYVAEAVGLWRDSDGAEMWVRAAVQAMAPGIFLMEPAGEQSYCEMYEAGLGVALGRTGSGSDAGAGAGADDE